MSLLRIAASVALAILAASAAHGQGVPLSLKPPAAGAKPVQGKPAPIDTATAVARANDYLNAASVMTADFVQLGADGRRTEGKLYVQKPGRMRFEYNSPATLEIIADGTSVAVRDKKLGTQDLYFIGQTPLKFLLNDRIDISRDTRLLNVSSEAASTSVFIEDRATFGGTSRIKLVFDSNNFALKQWKVVDPQGYETLVSLFNVDTTHRPDPALFRINQEKFRNQNTNR